MHLHATRGRSARHGFTLIELLTVIAIIAILAGLLMPVFNSVREQGRQGHCMSNMKAMIQAIKMYKDDNRVCPEALFGQSYDGVTIDTRLYPAFVKDQATFVCPNSPAKLTNPPALVDAINPITGVAARVAAFSSYDYNIRNSASATPARELHYRLKWTMPASTGLADDRRQLYFREPPDNTVVTWCLYHAGLDKNTGAVKQGHMALVAFWDGRVQKIDAQKLASWPGPDGNFPWQVAPKP